MSLRAEAPDWGPLERLFKLYGVPSHVLGQWMYMFSDGAIRAYKHTWTREYIYLDCSRAYKYCAGETYDGCPYSHDDLIAGVGECRVCNGPTKGKYRRITKMDALDRVLNGNTLASSIESRPPIHGS